MLGTLFSPSGRIGSAEFMRAGYILIIIGVAFGLTKLISPAIGAMFGLISVFLVYPWVVIWVKRLHNGGKTGWMIFLYILLYCVALITLAAIVMFTFGGGDFMTMITEQMNGDISQAEYMRKSAELGERLTLPMLISGLIASLATLFIGDKTIGNDPGDNEFGPGGDTFN